MHLKTLLTLGIFATVVCIGFLGYGLVTIAEKHAQLIEQEMISEAFSSGIQELNILADDYQLYHNERSSTQWKSRYNSLQTIMFQQKNYLSDRKMALLIRDFSKVLKLFQQIIEVYNKRAATASGTERSLQENALNEQLKTTLQIISSTARQMTQEAQEQLDDIISQIKRLLIALLFAIIAIVSIIWITLANHIITPIKTMCSEIKMFSDDINSRLTVKRNDEFGELASVFNSMANQLQETMVSKETLTHQTQYDLLTGLPNRLLFMDRLNQAIKQTERNEVKIAVLSINIDCFKEINDSYGHKTADDLLIHISQRLQKCIRDIDTVTRIGGDEFMVIIDSIRDGNIISDIIKKIMAKLAEPVPEIEHNLSVTLSIGISLYPEDADNTESLVRNADTAMYKAKEEGRNTYRYYNPENDTQSALNLPLL